MSARDRLNPMVVMSQAIRDGISKGSGVTKLTDIPDADLEAYAEMVTAYSQDLQGELARRKRASAS